MERSHLKIRSPRGAVGLGVRVIKAAAVAAVVVLLAADGMPGGLGTRGHGFASSAPLLLIGFAYAAEQYLLRARGMDLVKRLVLSGAFVLWGVDQLLPPGRGALVIGDVVISLYVLDLAAMVGGAAGSPADAAVTIGREAPSDRERLNSAGEGIPD